MSFFPTIPDSGGPPNVFTAYPQIYRPWAEMSQELMRGPSPLSPGERELILAYAAGLAGCEFVYVAHSEVAYAWGIENGLVDRLLEDLDSASVDRTVAALLSFVKRLVLAPGELTQADADAVLEAGWDEQALHDAIAVTARAAFMQRLVQGYGFTPLRRDVAARHAAKRVERGYVDLYPSLRRS
jgi:uncharacterized peroxidase-related enzyme